MNRDESTMRLFLVSTGPGDLDFMTPQARRAIETATDLVGYGLYLELLGPIAAGKQRHELPLGQEVERARLALDLAAGGRPTALVSSGDIGIYAMASVVFELLDERVRGRTDDDRRGAGWLDVDIEVAPGVSAMQAVASRVGALLGHDFCVISLSDLLTPWAAIERRIHAAGQGDFVTAFYNPVSRRRDWQLDHAREILLAYRPPGTPVVVARNVTRDNEKIRYLSLSALDADEVDMFSLVCVGNSETRVFETPSRSWVYTPRGYAGKPS